ncbi:MAG: cutinase family protein, partial [Acidimicrobiia bacterium]
VNAGVDALRATLEPAEAVCPSTEFLLVGYSQGAQVIKSTLTGVQPSVPIAGVVLLADPTRDATQRGIVRLGDPLAERNGAFGAIALPQHVSAVAVDVCAAGDGVCERGRQSFTAHVDGYDAAPELVVSFVLAELDSRGRFSYLPR